MLSEPNVFFDGEFEYSDMGCIRTDRLGYNRSIMLRTLRSIAFAALAIPVAAQSPPPLDANAIFERVKAATVMILAGEGAGRLHSIATGVLVAKNGVLFTALHAVKGAAEVQVRMPNGDVFDRVELMGSDERRDVAALRISAGNTSALPPGATANLKQGDPVYAVTNADGLSWSATEGIFSAFRTADEVPGAGSGFRVLQFTAPVAPGSSGGALVDRNGAVIGIITSSKGSAGFAVPIESIAGVPEFGPRTVFGSGSALQMPAKAGEEGARSSAAIAGSDPKEIVKNAKTIYIQSKTAFLTVDTVDHALVTEKDWAKLGLTIVGDQRVADLRIEIDRPLFTYIHTFVISDKKTSIVLGSGRVTAFDGTIASGGIAHDIVKFFAAAREPAPPAKK
jgi:hypothetical protein